MRYKASSVIGIVMALLAVTNAVLEFGFQNGVKGVTPLALGIALCMFAMSVHDAGNKRTLVLALLFAGALNFIAGCMQLLG